MSKVMESGLSESKAAFQQIPVTLQIIIGSKRLAFAEVAELEPGSILSLDQRLGESVSVEVNGVPIGKAELFVTEGDANRFAIRLIELASHDARPAP